ncbi:MAG: flagellar motor switch protein FliN [Chitinispirillaceae bacterium]|nr:flagellar motor switch protein FliN [Chitinispirillaceae bacterium]
MESFFSLFLEEAGKVISTLTNKNISFTKEFIDHASADKIKEKIPSNILAIKISFKPLNEGIAYLLIEKKNVAMLADLMVMGDGTVEYTEDHKDAIIELFSQVTGAFTNAISPKLTEKVSVEEIVAEEFDIDAPPLVLENYLFILAKEKIEERSDSFIAILVSKGFAEDISSKFKLDIAKDKGIEEEGEVGKDSFDESGEYGALISDSESGQFFPQKEPNIEMLLDIELDVSIELGKTVMSIKRILELSPGSIIELDRMAGEPVDLLVNNKVVAKGEVVVVDENFGIRIVSLVSPEERIRSLR